MKKFLSLVLALIMTMSLVTISAGAKDFTDDESITYEEAVAVMSEVKVLDGYADGSFKPQGGLTRGAAAKIICNLILGPTTAAELHADTAPYKDVAVDNTFAGYIAYCAKEGIISGYADGSFRPAAPLTGYAFMKMLLGALGYDSGVEGYTGANWSINVAKRAIGIGLNAGLVDDFSGIKNVTREEAALYAFNTLQATMVDYDTTITVGDVTITGSRAFDVANNAKVETIKDDNKMQFAEKYFNKLTVKDDVDAFERPCNTWTIGKETIGTFVDYTQIVAEYTTSVSGKDMYDIVGKTAFADYDFFAYVDGIEDDLWDEIAKNNKDDVSNTANGALTQVFVNNDKEEVVVTVINTYLAKATTDYSAKKDSVTYDIYGLTGEVGTVSGEDFDIEDVVTDDFALVTYSKSEDAIQSIDDVEIIEDTEIQKFKAGKSGNLTVEGTTYDYSAMAAYDADVLKDYTEVGGETNLKDLTYNVYLDAYGYVIGVDLVSTPDDYLFITGADDASSNLVNKTWPANAIFLDGTSKVIDVKNNGAITAAPVINKWYKFTVSNDDVYTLTLVNETTAITSGNGGKVAQKQTKPVTVIDAKHISLEGVGTDARVYGNDASVYLLADIDKVDTNVVITGVDEVVTGVKNAAFTSYDRAAAQTAANVTGTTATAANTSSGVYTLYKNNGYVIAAVVVGESDTVSSDLAYVISSGVSSESYDKSTKTWTWTRDVVIGGEKVTLKESNDTGLSVLKGLTPYTWVDVKYDAKGFVKKAPAAGVVTSVGAAVTAIEADQDLVVLDNTAANHVYSLKGSTIYDETSDKLGFLVAEDVKIVLKQTVKNKSTTTYDEGIKNLEATLKNLNESPNYSLDAVIEDGVANVVIIIDHTEDTSYTGPSGNDSTKVEVTVTEVNKTVNVASSDPSITWTAIAEHALEKLTDMGYAFKNWDESSKQLTVTNANGESVDFTVTCSLL